ncbi:membrane protein [gut metagenome]|uniref:Membrane protein n=1 Tax=gut metagenome TaxID=749906 RepID=J9FYF1_9ZZZZ
MVVCKGHGQKQRIFVNGKTSFFTPANPLVAHILCKIFFLFHGAYRIAHTQKAPQCVHIGIRFAAHIPLYPQIRIKFHNRRGNSGMEALNAATVQPEAHIVMAFIGCNPVGSLRQPVSKSAAVHILLCPYIIILFPLSKLANGKMRNAHHAAECQHCGTHLPCKHRFSSCSHPDKVANAHTQNGKSQIEPELFRFLHHPDCPAVLIGFSFKWHYRKSNKTQNCKNGGNKALFHVYIFVFHCFDGCRTHHQHRHIKPTSIIT